MSQCAPTGQLTRAERIAELREVLQWCIARVEHGDGMVTCTGLDDDTCAALVAYQFNRTPAALAAVHAAAERRVAGIH